MEVISNIKRKLISYLLKLRAILLLCTAFSGMFLSYMTLNMMVGPGLSAILAKYHIASCDIETSVQMSGKHNCSWSSCVEGCTTDVFYKCWQVHVNLSENSTYLDNLQEFENTSYVSSMEQVVIKEKKVTRLQVNTLGCGYESCNEWFENLPGLGQNFTCYVNEDASISLMEVDAKGALWRIILGLLPLLLGVGSIIIIYRLYCREGAKDSTLMLDDTPQRIKQRQEEAKFRLLKRLSERSDGSHIDLKLLMAISSGVQNKFGEDSGDVSSCSGKGLRKKDKSNKVLALWKKAVKSITEQKMVPEKDYSFETLDEDFTESEDPLRCSLLSADRHDDVARWLQKFS